MGKRIFLVETSVEEQNRQEYNKNSSYPLGLAYLDAILKKEGYDVVTKDFAQNKEKEYLDYAKSILINFKPEILGISMMSMTRVSSYKLMKIAKKINPKIKIIAGGIHASVMYEQLLKNFPIDCIIIGEGEETIKEVVPALLENKNLSKIKGIAFKKKNKIIKTKERDLICNLDDLPFPSHEAFMNKKRTRIVLLSSRGCPNKCSFCALHIISKRRYRMRSCKNVVDEIELLIKNPRIKEIEFSDDTFTLSEQRIIDFCKEIVKRKIKKDFICSARIKPITEKMLYWMQKAGFKEIRFGIETGSRKMLESIHKAITPEDIIETFKAAKKFPKIKFIKFLMVGFPGESKETIKETIELVKKIQKIVPMNFFCAQPLWVYPGTEIYEKMKAAGKINDDFWLSDKPCPYYTVDYTQEEIFDMANRIGFATSYSRGLGFFLAFLAEKYLNNPVFQTKRIIKNKFFIPILMKKIRGS